MPLIEIVSNAESEVRKLIEEALAQNRYADVASAARVADHLARIVVELSSTCNSDPYAPDPNLGTTLSGTDLSGQTTQRRRSARDYPRYAKDGERLIKFAWSKKDRAEYEHRTPRQTVQLFLEAVRKKKGTGKIFKADEIFPIKDPATKQEIPSYQAYLALGWLCHEGLVTKKGRDGYVLKALASTDRIASLWDALPSA